MSSSGLAQPTVIETQVMSQPHSSLKDPDDDFDVCISQIQSTQLDTSGRSAADRYFWLSGPPRQQARSQSQSSLKDRLDVEDDNDDDADVCLSETQSNQLDTSGRSAPDRYFWLSGPPRQQSKGNEGCPPEQYSQAPGFVPQSSTPGYTTLPDGMAYAPRESVPGYTTLADGMAYALREGVPGYTTLPDGMAYAPQEGVPGYTTLPDGMAYAPREGVPGYTHQDAVIVTQPEVQACQQEPVPPSNLILSFFSYFFCCWPISTVAIIFSCLSQDSARLGDMKQAKIHGDIALCLDITSMGLGAIITIGFLTAFLLGLKI